MSQQNVESLRQGLAAFNRRDMTAWLAMCDPGLENIPPRDWPESDPIRGPQAVWDFFVEAQEAWGEESSPFEFVEVIEAANDAVVADVRRDVRGKSSGAAVAFNYWQVATLRSGKVVRFEWFTNRAEALEAAGLPE